MKLTALIATIFTAASIAALADTIAWWHFDECDPGTTAPANTVASDQAPTKYAHVYTVGDSGTMSSTHENSGDYLPAYTKPFRGLAVYDPVTDTTRTNNAAMKFSVARGGSNPNGNAGRAWYGGALKFDGGYNLYSSLYGTSALTVEAFVCTTGGVYNTFAPIVGSVGGTSFTSERWALLMETDGSIAVRLTAGSTTPSIFYSGGTGGRGKSKVNKTRKTVRGATEHRQVLMKFGGTPYFNVLFNALNSGLLYAYTIDGNQIYHSTSAGADDGKWHHVAAVIDGTAQKISFYFDYQLARAKTGTLPNVGAISSSMFFGAKENGGGQFFDGWIDDIRVTRRALTPDEFLTTHPVGSGWTPSSNKLTIDGRWHHYAFTFEPVNDGTNTLVKLFYDYKNVGYGSQSKTGVTLGFRLPKRVTGHRLMLGEGSNAQPNLVGKFDAVRVSKGVLDPSQFIVRAPNAFMLIVR